MLTCRELAHRHASDYLDGQLGWRERLGVRYHLLICKHCRRFVAQLSKVRTLLRDRPKSAPVNDSADQLSQQLISQQQLAEQLAKVYEQQKKSPPPL